MVSRSAMDAGLLPVKGLARAKSRLASRFDDAGRAAIVGALLDDALALVDAASLLEWWVVSDDDDVLRRASALGTATVRDPGTGLNEAVALGVAAVASAGATSVAVVPADVPLATRGDLEDLLDTGATSDVVVVPSHSGGGTNTLYLSPPDLMAPQFGPGSLSAHVRAADRRGLRCSILPLARLGLDLDTPADVDTLLARPEAAATHTGAVLGRLART